MLIDNNTRNAGILMSGAVADIALWRNKRLSASILIGITTVWILFEVAEYHFLTLLCHASIAAMLFVFIWSNGAAMLDLYLISQPIFSRKCYGRKKNKNKINSYFFFWKFAGHHQESLKLSCQKKYTHRQLLRYTEG